MALFWIVAAAMAAMAVALVLVPLLRARAAPAGPSDREANLEVLRGQRREIEADIAAGTLPADAREEALAELVGRAADDLAAEPPAQAQARKPVALAAALAVAIPALAFGIYLSLGSPRALDADLHAAGKPVDPGKLDEKEIVAMVEGLAAKVKERPDDARGWALLARSMAGLGRFRESADAYAHLVTLVPDDAQVFADYADALGMAQGRNLAGKPVELARRALVLDPRNIKAIALLATEAADAGRFAESVRHWESLRALLPPESDDVRQVSAIIAEMKAQTQVKAGTAKDQAGKSAGSAAVTGTVTLSKEVAAKLQGDEALFVFARAEGGPKVPLAVVRSSARDLPLKFALDDSHAMAPGMNLSSATAVRIEARVSRSGNAAPQSGDLVGTSAVVKPGARDVSVVLDKVLP